MRLNGWRGIVQYAGLSPLASPSTWKLTSSTSNTPARDTGKFMVNVSPVEVEDVEGGLLKEG